MGVIVAAEHERHTVVSPCLHGDKGNTGARRWHTERAYKKRTDVKSSHACMAVVASAEISPSYWPEKRYQVTFLGEKQGNSGSTSCNLLKYMFAS